MFIPGRSTPSRPELAWNIARIGGKGAFDVPRAFHEISLHPLATRPETGYHLWTTCPSPDDFQEPTMADKSKQRIVQVVTRIDLHVTQRNKLLVDTSDLIFDEEGKLIEVKPQPIGSDLVLPIDLRGTKWGRG